VGWENEFLTVITLPTGATSGARIVIDGTNDRILIYDANNALIGVLAGSAGTVSGLSYPAGLTIFNDPPNGYVEVQSNGTIGESPTLHFGSGQLLQLDTQIFAISIGNGQERFDIFGPANANDAVIAQALIHLFSSDNTGNNAAMQLSLQNDHGGQYFFVDATMTGTKFRGTLLSCVPGVLSSGVPATETWHAPVLNANYRSDTISHPLRYRYEAINGGVLRLDGGVQTQGAGPWPAGDVICNIPTPYRPVNGKRSYITRSAVAPALNAGTVAVLNTGDLTIDTALTAAGQQVYFDGVTAPLD
jgi:hypothetical protein